MMNQELVITTIKNDSEELLRESEAGKHMSIRLKQTKIKMVNGFLRPMTVYGFVPMEKASAIALLESGILHEGKPWKEVVGQEFQIQVVETTEKPQFGHPQPKINPQTGEILKCANTGKPIYRTTVVTDKLEAEDIFIQHATDKVGASAPAQTGKRVGEQFD